MIKIRLRVFVILSMILMSLVLEGCNLPMMQEGGSSDDEILEIQIAQTMVAIQAMEMTETARVAPLIETDALAPLDTLTSTLTLSPTFTSTSTITLTPTITLTATLGKPMVSVRQNTNCRKGPGTVYDIVGALLVGEEAEIVARSEDGGYWIIQNPDGAGECWLWGYYATAVGPTDGLPTYMPPPTPTPAFDWAGSWTASIVASGDPPGPGRPMTITVDDKDFSASMDIGCGGIVNLVGTIADDYLSVSGTWLDTPYTGSFKLFAVGTNQFQGSRVYGTDMHSWCGWRGGAGAPSPCYRE